MRSLAILGILWLSVGITNAAEKRPMQIEDLFRFKRIGDAQIHPDGDQVVYTMTTVSLENNKSSTSLWLVSLDEAAQPRVLTNPNGKSDGHPRWSPDGKSVLFESSRSGSSQIWVISTTGGEARQLTTISTGASNATWSPDGKSIAFVSGIFPENSDKPYAESNVLNAKRIEAQEQNPVKAKVFTKLFFRHWDEYVDGKRQHLFVLSLDENLAPKGDPKDVTPGDRDAYPTSTTFSVGDEFTFSPDGTHLIFTAVPMRDEAWSTNYDLCRVPVKGGGKEWESLTAKNTAADGCPRFSPDGKQLGYRAQRKAGYEADKWEIMVVATDASGKVSGEPKSLTGTLDRSADDFVWTSNESITFTAEENAATPLFGVKLSDGSITKNPHLGQVESRDETPQGTSGSLSVSRQGVVSFTRAFMSAPAEVYAPRIVRQRRPLSGQYENVSQANTALLAELDLPRPESVTVKGAGGTPMQMWILKPPGFDATKKWPVAFLVHGGPQGAWNDGWSFRWNPQIWAAQGYVVALPNPRGSTGFGQTYVDQISGDWGGKCYADLMAGADYIEALPFVDRERIGAAGASFGGYMMNWFATQTGRFKTLITHCGVYNFDSMYALTEELWFDEWEHGGPPWGTNRDSYEKHSPHRFAGNLGKFKTPMLIIHNDLDFRVPVAEGLQLFTALQRQRVPSRMINFPDEGHWVTKPKNSLYWHREVFKWLKEHVPPGPK